MKNFCTMAIPSGTRCLRRQAAHSVWHYMLLGMLVCCLTACGAQQQLSNTSSSVDETVKHLLENLEKKDTKALQAMHITEQEFRTLIFPGLPIGKIKEWQNAYDYVWGDTNTKNNYGLNRVLGAYGGKKLQFVKIRFAKGTTKYELENKLQFLGKSYNLPFGQKTYTGYEDSRVTIKDENGKEEEVKLFGGIIEYQGRYKIISFNIAS